MTRRDWMIDAVAAGVFTAAAAQVRSHEVGSTEERIFRLINDAPDRARVPVWAVMQMGSFAAVGVATAIEARLGRRTAVPMAVVGTGVWAGVKYGKAPLFGRGRPHRHLEQVRVRGEDQHGLGFPSGHAAVSATIAHIGSVERPSWARAALHAGAVATGLSRIYIGAHLPLDVAAGWAVGRLAGRVGRRLAG